MKTTSKTRKTYRLGGVSVRIRSDRFCREGGSLVLYQSPARAFGHRTGDGREGLALWLLLASA
jgi:hypothetical protein